MAVFVLCWVFRKYSLWVRSIAVYLRSSALAPFIALCTCPHSIACSGTRAHLDWLSAMHLCDRSQLCWDRAHLHRLLHFAAYDRSHFPTLKRTSAISTNIPEVAKYSFLIFDFFFYILLFLFICLFLVPVI